MLDILQVKAGAEPGFGEIHIQGVLQIIIAVQQQTFFLLQVSNPEPSCRFKLFDDEQPVAIGFQILLLHQHGELFDHLATELGKAQALVEPA